MHASDSRHGSHREIIVLDREAVRAVDRAAIDEYGIPSIVLMENAARALCEAALTMLGDARAGTRHVLIICGSGNNGGDGYALARHLHNRGVVVQLAALGEPKPNSDAGVNRRICERMGLSIIDARILPRRDSAEISLIVDAIFGTGLDREVTGDAALVIEWMNRSACPILAADVPSGMDCNTGRQLGACVRASRTVTFVGLKPGFLSPDAQKLLGEVVVGDIGAPRELIERFGRRV